MSALSLRGLTKRFGDVAAVDHVDLEVPSGAFVTLLGPSGCGKTTTLRLIAGFETATGGEIWLGDRRIDAVPANRREMAMVFQSYALFPHLTVFENVAYGLRVRKVPEPELRERVRERLRLSGLQQFEQRTPAQLSGGQQQRVALARALVVKPRVLLFDEPLSNLDAKLRVQMRDEIRRLQRDLGITAIYVTHDQSEAMALSDQIVVMNQGRIEQTGAPPDVYARPATHFVADFIGRANFLPADVVAVTDGVAEVQALGVPVRLRADQAAVPLQPGTRVDLVVRPEAFHLPDGGPPAGTSGWQGTIRHATYLGGHVEYEVEIAGRPVLIVDPEPVAHGLRREGETVPVSVTAGALHALAPGGERGG